MRRLGAAALALLTSCGMFPEDAPPLPYAEVRGERRAAPAEPLRRVLLLPLRTEDAVPAHAASLSAALAQALRAVCGFEVVSLAASDLPRDLRDAVLGGHGLEVETCVRLHRDWQVDAVLFGRLAFSRAQGEPAFGLDLELIDVRDGSRLWSACDVVDARAPAIRAALLAFRGAELGGATRGSDEAADASQVPLDSFARFVASSFVRTLYPKPVVLPPADAAETGAARADREKAAQVPADSSE